MTPEQASELKSLITDMKEKQFKAFGGNTSALTYNAWVASTEAVNDYINSITIKA